MDVDALTVINERKPANLVNAPTTDDQVRKALRGIGEPVTYFGEDKADRRARLVDLLSNRNLKGTEEGNGFGSEDEFEDSDVDDEMDDDNEEFYTPGSDELLTIRKEILSYSLDKSRNRLAAQKKHASKSTDFIKILKYRRSINSKLEGLELYGSQSLATRALSKIRYSRIVDNGKMDNFLAVGSWDGSIHILDSDLSEKHKSIGKHTEKVSAIDWSRDNSNVLSGGGEGSINVWNVKSESNETISNAHPARITETLYHPSGAYFASTSFDQTWKLWDATTLKTIYQQEGHSKEVYCGSFHPDGGIFSSAGLDAIGYIWDLRSGRSISILQGHIQGIYSMDWAPNGIHLATASGDCSVKIWDLRNPTSELFSIPAHSKLVSEVRFLTSNSVLKGVPEVTDEFGTNPERLSNEFVDDNAGISDAGSFLVTSSYDGLVNVWSADNWVKVKTLQGHNDKVMSCDISPTGTIASCGWDRTVKIWQY
ncbi:U4/U6 small nuclear ribonucleoprotein Prp4p [[Candida] railenensis]|uniref:U4/U6 small nuclear ribonucleoprotein Prp4p n=1 Tax=[Candida] railenensis TaxID=45579 RepID=A0A9P0VYB6_9ASCO|nr:U4/U6 small nuclear ribonucleoprotein Prp4p [[Candida] railenensis]